MSHRYCISYNLHHIETMKKKNVQPELNEVGMGGFSSLSINFLFTRIVCDVFFAQNSPNSNFCDVYFRIYHSERYSGSFGSSVSLYHFLFNCCEYTNGSPFLSFQFALLSIHPLENNNNKQQYHRNTYCDIAALFTYDSWKKCVLSSSSNNNG